MLHRDNAPPPLNLSSASFLPSFLPYPLLEWPNMSKDQQQRQSLWLLHPLSQKGVNELHIAFMNQRLNGKSKK